MSGAVFSFAWGMCVRMPKAHSAAVGLGYLLITGVLPAFVNDANAWCGVVFFLAAGLCLTSGVRAMRRG
ncbi:hypothetical protein LRR80_03849 [Streptomyces sp. RO-S4]|uniref:hypothetical protein n=1 Tax=unclassified Streptomyces TaxID=2593676 RepID=UPI001E49B41B|nr:MULTISPECIES: hypothetical protein [unclassified Streptomyces]MCO4697781.1 hypothetical protein [Streptomyces sp. RO-S4]MDU0304686.1 hypothetical protein [Streptomyces sp. PAL114]